MATPICPFCQAKGNTQSIRASKVYGGKDFHKFWQCSVCELVYLWPTLSDEEEKLFYAKEFEKFMSSRAGADRDWSGAEKHIQSNQDNVKRRLKFMEDYLKPGLDILEIGCSSGFMMEAFRNKGLNPIGIEPSEQFLDFLKQKGFESYATLEEFKKNNPGKKFDLITHFFVFEHIKNTKQFIEDQLQLLKPGGTIIAETPCMYDPLTSVYKIPAFENFYWSIHHPYYLGPKSLGYMLEKINCVYKFMPEQRYDLSNHIFWMTEGKPGGQGKYSHIFSEATNKSYQEDLKKNWKCDTFFSYITHKK